MKIVDLTLPLPPGLKTNPTHPETIITDHVTHWFTAPRYQSPCKGYASKLLLICDHIGTHLDAPLHFIPDGKSMDAVPLENTLGEAMYLDLSDKPAEQPVTVEMLEKKLAANGEQIKPGDIVLLRTWPGQWGDAIFKAAGISWPAAKWLRARKIKSVGLGSAERRHRRRHAAPMSHGAVGQRNRHHREPGQPGQTHQDAPLFYRASAALHRTYGFPHSCHRRRRMVVFRLFSMRHGFVPVPPGLSDMA